MNYRLCRFMEHMHNKCISDKRFEAEGHRSRSGQFELNAANLYVLVL